MPSPPVMRLRLPADDDDDEDDDDEPAASVDARPTSAPKSSDFCLRSFFLIPPPPPPLMMAPEGTRAACRLEIWAGRLRRRSSRVSRSMRDNARAAVGAAAAATVTAAVALGACTFRVDADAVVGAALLLRSFSPPFSWCRRADDDPAMEADHNAPSLSRTLRRASLLLRSLMLPALSSPPLPLARDLDEELLLVPDAPPELWEERDDSRVES